MKKQKKKRTECGWCGTGLRGRPSCPRGPACAAEEANSVALEERIKKGAK